MVRHLKITVEGKIYDVVVEDVTEGTGGTLYPAPGSMAAARAAAVPAAAPSAPAPAPVPGGADEKVAPLGGVIIEITVKVGDQVKAGDKVAVIEAMKMKTVVSAHKDGKVTNIAVKVGDAVDAGQPLISIS
jgi:biotin carboxyl carrier protein